MNTQKVSQKVRCTLGHHRRTIEEIENGIYQTCKSCSWVGDCVYDYEGKKELVEVPECEWTEMLIDIGGEG